MGDWKLISKKIIVDNPWRRVEEWLTQLPNGKEIPFSVQVAPDVVVVFGLTEDKQVVLTHQYYVAHEKKVPTFVVGYIDDGDTPEQAAKRELLEEAGCTATSMIALGSTIKGKYATGHLYYFLAEGVKKTHDQALEDAEDIDMSFVPLAEFLPMLRQGDIHDVFHVACAYRALDYLKLL